MLDVSGNWDHQNRGRAAMAALRAAGVKSAVGVAPCGAGKSRVMFQEAVEEVQRGGGATIAVHRSLLLDQMRGQLTDLGIPFGVIESGTKPDLDQPLQLASIHTLYSWAVKKLSIDLPDSSLVLLDEAHANSADMTRALLYGAQEEGFGKFVGWIDRGAFVEGFTGTPVNLNGLYDELVSFGSYSEMRRIKAHLNVRVYGPEEIDVTDLKLDDSGEYSNKSLEPRTYKIWGSCYEWWKRLNPDAQPALLFGPSSAAARWFAWEFVKQGVPAAYIGSDCCLLPSHLPCGTLWLDQYPPELEYRRQALSMSETGEIAVLCNRFVLREAIDMPWIRHGIAATVFGGVSTYLQSVGRIQRYYEGYPDKIWQSHGGCYWRHGSPNMDRHWKLGDTNRSIAKLRREAAQRAKNGQDVEGIQCPRCNGWRTGGSQCPHCGHMHKRSVRPVRQIDGELKLMTGAVTKAKAKRTVSEQAIWNGVLYGSVKTGRAVSSAAAMFFARAKAAGIAEPNVWGLVNPPPSRNTKEWHSKVSEVYPNLKPKHGKPT